MPALLKELESGDVFELGDFCVIGRNEDVAIRLAHPGISRQHASIRREGQNYWLVDLGSANGTFVNDVALTSARALRHGDRIQLGALVLTFQQSEADTRPDFSANAKTQISRLAPAPMRNEPVTLFVADLKGFTQMSAALSAGQVADLLSEWYADCNAILKGHGASIDKFIGDCVFAYWHGTEPEIRVRALQSAEALRAVEIAPTSPIRIALRAQRGITLDCRIGMHIGMVAIGAMGQGVNTALGDAVNMAFRIESLTRVVDRSTLVSAAFLEGWDEGRSQFESCGLHQVKGQADLIEVFAPRRVNASPWDG